MDVMTRHLEGEITGFKKLPCNKRSHLGEKVNQRKVREQDDRLLVVASSYAWVLHLAEVGKAKKKVCVKLERGEDAGIEIPVSLHQWDSRARATYPEVELSVSHYSGVGVREGEVTDVGSVMLRQ